jgi:hypothetical protein
LRLETEFLFPARACVAALVLAALDSGAQAGRARRASCRPRPRHRAARPGLAARARAARGAAAPAAAIDPCPAWRR